LLGRPPQRRRSRPACPYSGPCLENEQIRAIRERGGHQRRCRR
jgi:hypothetical protein